MKIDILALIKAQRFIQKPGQRHFDDDIVRLNPGQKIDAEYVKPTTTGDLEIHVSDGSLLKIPKENLSDIKYEETPFITEEVASKVSPPRGRGGGCCGGGGRKR